MFCQERSICGWSKFIEIKSLEDKGFGFIKDGWITFAVHVEVLEDEQELPVPNLTPAQIPVGKDIVCNGISNKNRFEGVA